MNNTAVREATLEEHQAALCVLLRELDRVCVKLNIPYMLFAGSMLGAVRHGGMIPWDDDLDVIMRREDYGRFLREADLLLDRERFFLQKEFSEHWPMFFSKLRLNRTACLEKYHPKDKGSHQGVYIDIFPCDDAASGELGRRLQFAASKVVIAKSLDRRGYDTDSRKKKLFMAFCRALPMKPFLNVITRRREKSGYCHSFLGAGSDYAKNVYPREWMESLTECGFEGGQYPVSAYSDSLLTHLYGDYLKLPSEEERAVKKHAILVDLENSYEMYEHYRDGMTFDVHTRSIR